MRDKDGNLKLSQAAQKYHPGTGVYRSSYKNAMRVARTEVNMAYQASDSERWTRSWWVKGIRVSLSNNHTSPDSKGRPAPLVDICDELAGAAKRGTTPYFIANDTKYTNPNWKQVARPKTPLEIADERHARRTLCDSCLEFYS